MNLTLYRPRTALDRWNGLFGIDRGLDGVFELLWPTGLRDEEPFAWAPPVDVKETKDAVVVETDLPGIEREDIEIKVLEDALHIKGERKREKGTKEDGYYRTERTYGTFHRSITLPTAVDEKLVNATFKNGVLRIHLPKSEEVKPVDIKIEGEE